MVFSSPAFLSFFLPLAFLACLLLRRWIKAQNACLMVLSVVFYAWGEPVYVLLILALTFLNGGLARWIEGAKVTPHQNALTALAVVLNMGLLLVIKYAAFLVQTLNALLGLSLSIPHIPLPLGISFFTFQALSYVLDVRRGRTTALRNQGTLLLYLCFFPQLIAGPIIQWGDIADQFAHRRMTPEDTALGLRRLIVGLSKKILLADVLGQVADAAFACPAAALNLPFAWLGALAYTLQIYLDFSGYSDMAIGMGHMFGFSFPENFRHPLRAGSMQLFWRHWHITLTDWFRVYLYIPLGGNRHGSARTYRNLAIVFLCTGLWHGAAWTFVLWGAWNGLFVIAERAGVLRVNRWPAALGHVYTLAVVLLGFVLFRAESLAQAGRYLLAMVGGNGLPQASWSCLLEQCTPMNLTTLLIAVLVSVNAGSRLRARLLERPWGQGMLATLCCALLMASYAAMLASGYHPFLYFRF